MERKKKVLLGFGILAAVTTTAVVLSKPAQADITPGTANLSGTVVDALTSQPLGGVVVSLEGLGSTQTNSSGYYLIQGLTPGEYSVSFYKEGYETIVM